MKTKTTASSHPDTKEPASKKGPPWTLADVGGREFAFELRYKGKIVRGESYAWDWHDVDKPNIREMKEYTMEPLRDRGAFPQNRSGYNRARFTFKPGPLLTGERYDALRERKWAIEEAA